MQKQRCREHREPFPIDAALRRLRSACRAWRVPIVTGLSRSRRDPFRVLISTMLSLRTKDETTEGASARLFALADTPEAMRRLDEERIAAAIYPVGFYRTKARAIRRVCHRLTEEFGSRVPRDIDTLLTFPGVGRKTANLVLTRGHFLPGICVDTHVHRIANRWGSIGTRTPEQSEMALRAALPRRWWMAYHDLLVAFGQNLCTPVSPRCSQCPLAALCPRIGVTRSR